MKVLRYLVALIALLAAPAVALAQASTANQVTPGFLSTSGCPSAATTPCFIPYSATNPVPTSGASTPSGTASNAADGVATSTNNQSSVVYPFLWNGATFDRWPGDATNGAFVNVKVLPALATGTNGIGYVGGFNANLSNAPTVQNAAYSASNAIGGLQTVAAFRNNTRPSGILNYVQVISAGGSTQGMTIYGWTKTPSATCTDKVAYAANAADYANSIPGFPVALTPAVTQGTTASRASQSIVVSVKNTDSSPTVNLYFCAVVNGSVTPASTTDLTFSYSIAQD